MPGGRPRKPVKQLEIEGNPGKRPLPEVPEADGKPVKPRGMSKDAAKYWDEIVGQVTRFGAGACDSGHIASLCEMYSLYKMALKEVREDICNAKARATMVAAWGAYHKACIQYGITPVARIRLGKPGEDGGDENPLNKLGIVG